MTPTQISGLVLFLLVLFATAGFALRWLLLRSRTQQRWAMLSQVPDASTDADTSVQHDGRWWLARWMYLAGYRQPRADWVFLIATGLCLGFGLSIALGMQLSGLQAAMERTVVLVPGGVGETFLPVVWVAPWLLLIMLTCVPWLIVRRARRERVELVEQDLPLALELLSTLSEAGLGFDAALARILKTRLAGRPLAEEFRIFQSDLLAGRPRTQSLRRFSARLDVPSISVFASAMVQAEQLGMGIARVLRLQADDVRARRRERAIAFANALPTKRVIPLVVCFLPGLFVWTLGPAFVQLFKMAESFIQVRDL
ncbi:MAG: type II secretion system F family protein [Planctomycetaceae bacterium]